MSGWKCTGCGLYNPDDATHCRRCENAKPTLLEGSIAAPSASAAATGGWAPTLAPWCFRCNAAGIASESEFRNCQGPTYPVQPVIVVAAPPSPSFSLVGQIAGGILLASLVLFVIGLF